MYKYVRLQVALDVICKNKYIYILMQVLPRHFNE